MRHALRDAHGPANARAYDELIRLASCQVAACLRCERSAFATLGLSDAIGTLPRNAYINVSWSSGRVPTGESGVLPVVDLLPLEEREEQDRGAAAEVQARQCTHEWDWHFLQQSRSHG